MLFEWNENNRMMDEEMNRTGIGELDGMEWDEW